MLDFVRDLFFPLLKNSKSVSPGNQGKVRESEKGLKSQGICEEKRKVREFKQVV